MSALVPRERIEQTLLVIRGHNVMLDSDLAQLYGVTVGRLNEAVKRNEDRFPSDFMFQLTKPEFEHLKSQIAISSSKWGGRRHAPYAFTEQGVAMLSSVLPTGAIGLATGGELVYIHECVYVGDPEVHCQLRETWRPV